MIDVCIIEMLYLYTYKEVGLPEGLPETASNFSNEPDIHSFILRLWREEIGTEKSEGIWRGHITFIPNGERQYFTDINQIPALIASHLNRDR